MYKINYENINKYNELYGKNSKVAIEFNNRMLNVVRVFEKVKVIDFIVMNSGIFFKNNVNDDVMKKICKELGIKESIKKINIKERDGKIKHTITL